VIVGPGGQFIPVGRAVYDAADNAVILSPVARLNLHLTYVLEVVGVGPFAVSSATGVPLAGSRLSRPGTNFVTLVTIRNWVIGPFPEPVPLALTLLMAKKG
jgi:hypothetical protein